MTTQASEARHLLKSHPKPSLKTLPQQPSWVPGGRPPQRPQPLSWAPQLGSTRLCEALALPQVAPLLQQLARTQLLSQVLALGKQVKVRGVESCICQVCAVNAFSSSADVDQNPQMQHWMSRYTPLGSTSAHVVMTVVAAL